jgi:D-cysteine desulfhydrase family pyridoxal phosphate-dependent enzyme
MIPRIQFAHLPTPVEPMPRLSTELGINLLVKRDDQTGLAFGGNKTRKLEFLLAEAQAHGARTLITAGAVQSNHCRQTAAVAARFGLDCILVLAGEPPQNISANLLLDGLLGAEIVWARCGERQAALQCTFDQAWADGRRPYLIPYGGSSPTGAAAYAYALEELLSQSAAPDWIVFASSSGGTQAGLAAGARRSGYQGQILGISIDEAAGVLQARVAALAGETADRLGMKAAFTPQDILVNDEYLGKGYGILGAAEVGAIRLFAQKEGLLLDPVYTGRAAAGLIGLARRGYFKPTDTVLFWHTGGTPALFADAYAGLLSSDSGCPPRIRRVDGDSQRLYSRSTK